MKITAVSKHRISFLCLWGALILMGAISVTADENRPVSKAGSTLTINLTAVPTAAYQEMTASDKIDLSKLRSQSVKIQDESMEKGKNYWSIAKKYNIDIYTLIGANPDLPFKSHLHQMLHILSQKGVLHTVAPDEDLSKIAAEYRTDEKTLKVQNGISWWHRLHTGDVLFVPNARPFRMVKEWKEYFNKRGLFGVPFSRWATWTSGFGLRVDPFTGQKKEHTGVDLRAKFGDPVYASAAGTVIFTGLAGGYGNLIKIKHKNGYTTYYGHLSKIDVQPGQKVRRGAYIGRVGATGRVTGPHLHFEIRKNGIPVNPLQYI